MKKKKKKPYSLPDLFQPSSFFFNLPILSTYIHLFQRGSGDTTLCYAILRYLPAFPPTSRVGLACIRRILLVRHGTARTQKVRNLQEERNSNKTPSNLSCTPICFSPPPPKERWTGPFGKPQIQIVDFYKLAGVGR